MSSNWTYLLVCSDSLPKSTIRVVLLLFKQQLKIVLTEVFNITEVDLEIPLRKMNNSGGKEKYTEFTGILI